MTIIVVASRAPCSVLPSCGAIKNRHYFINSATRARQGFAQVTMRSLLRVSSFISAMLICAALPAQTFDQLEEILTQHPQLQGLGYRAIANREQADSVMALPDPVVSFGVNNFPVFDPSFTEFLPTHKALGFQQRFPSRAARLARSNMSSAEAKKIDEQHRQTFAAMRAELIALLYNKQRIAEQRALAEQRDAKYDQLIDAVEAAVQGGRSSVFRLPEIEAERAEVARTKVDLAAELAQVDARLEYLVGETPNTRPPQHRVADWSGDAMAFYASRVADADVQVSNSGVDEAKSAWKPEWGAQITYQQRETGVNFAGDDWVSMMVTVTVPFWAKHKQAPQLRAAKARQAAAQANVDHVRRQAIAQYSYSRAVYRAAEQAIDILQQKIRAITNEIAIQQTSYESGAGDYSPIIDGEIAILNLRAEIATETARQGISAAQLNALMVTP